ncbi:MAG: hypothetical protein A3E82_06570 [Gammaproteobacteria bacterium RIFCSPHIGHO2_12_FULL_38_11]|nr:MAG: hypothetical protein A3E82_06570 [Gammaproteobacteria bacterium RIFCSPHIGHO2_12_FULL_38_11]
MKFSLSNNRFGILTHMHGMSDHKKHYIDFRKKLSRVAVKEAFLSATKLEIASSTLKEELFSATKFYISCLALTNQLSDAATLSTKTAAISTLNQPTIKSNLFQNSSGEPKAQAETTHSPSPNALR